MSNENFIEEIELLNKEYLNDKYYNLGKRYSKIINFVKKGKILNLLQLLINYRKKKCVIDENIEYKKYKNKENKKIVIYTCITGNYDKVEEPIYQEDIEYILFTNNTKITSKKWKVVNIPKEILALEDNIKINRYIKMHPKELFPQYDYAIYLDGNIKIISSITDFINNINTKTGLAIHRHCGYDCIYEEVKNCIANGKGNSLNLKKQINRYKKQGFPRNYGLLECNVLVSDLNNNVAIDIFNNWWNEYIYTESKRDQIALPYTLWKNDIEINDIGNLGYNVNKNYKIKINSHK